MSADGGKKGGKEILSPTKKKKKKVSGKDLEYKNYDFGKQKF
jgi:hypothetical protein